MKYIFVLISTFICPATFADNQKIWLIGGGNIRHNSQEQIEKNVLWLDKIFRNSSEKYDYNVYFGSGNSADTDVLYWSEDLPENEIVLQRVFNKKSQSGLSYKHHSLTSVNGSTKKIELIQSLSSDFEQLSDNTSILFVYNGHGGREYNNEKNNYLKLWGDTRLSVSELGDLFNKAPRSSTVRFVLTQCYSGAFYDLVSLSESQKTVNGTPHSQIRCGFMAESEIRQSEGCTLETNPNEFRDYTTYFFAALKGKNRTGSELISDPDINGDNSVSFREAHLYTLKTARNKDLSRSTSEVYLEKWQPWYLRWQETVNNEESIYWQLALDVAFLGNLPAAPHELSKIRPSLVTKLAATEKNLSLYEHNIKLLQTGIQGDLHKKWPHLSYSIETGISEDDYSNKQNIVSFIKKHRQYIELLDLLKLYLPSLTQHLELERDLTQIDKIFRLRRIAWLEQQLYKYASEDEINQYNDLLNCEKTGFL